MNTSVFICGGNQENLSETYLKLISFMFSITLHDSFCKKILRHNTTKQY
jgi:mannitol/fructose-specific phosphotransferase system IIA component (Ntr-type)